MRPQTRTSKRIVEIPQLKLRGAWYDAALIETLLENLSGEQLRPIDGGASRNALALSGLMGTDLAEPVDENGVGSWRATPKLEALVCGRAMNW